MAPGRASGGPLARLVLERASEAGLLRGGPRSLSLLLQPHPSQLQASRQASRPSASWGSDRSSLLLFYCKDKAAGLRGGPMPDASEQTLLPES